MSTATTAVTTRSQAAPAAVTLRSLIAKPEYQARFREVLGQKAQQFMTSLVNVGNTMRDVEPNSIMQSAMIAAGLDLPIDKNLGFAWIVPYKKGADKLAQFQMGYKGYVQLGLRSGQYQRMNARAINAEAFNGFDEVGEPIIAWDKVDETKDVAGYVFAFKLVNGYTKVCYWTKKRIEEHAKRYSQSYRGKYESPWKTHFDEMALKTVVKNELSRWGIMSIQMAEAVEKDQGVVDSEGKISFADNAEVTTAPKFDEPPPPLLGEGEGNSDGDGDVAPQTQTQPEATTQAPVEPEPENEKSMAIRTLTSSNVAFDDFRDWVAVKRLKGHENASSWASYDEVPLETYRQLTIKNQADIIKTYGSVQK